MDSQANRQVVGAFQPPIGRPHDLLWRLYNLVRDPVIGAASIVALLGLWVLFGVLFPSMLTPSITETFTLLWNITVSGEVWTHMAATLRRVFVGFGVAMIISIPVGILMGTTRLFETFFKVPMMVGLTMPGLIWALLSVMVFGLSEVSAYAAVALSVLPVIAINVWQGTKGINKDLIEMARAFHAPTRDMVVDVILPQLVYYLIAATRYGLGLAWKVVVLVEMFGRSSGVGYQVIRGFDLLSVNLVLAWAFAFLIVMLVIDVGIIGFIERRLTAWRPRVQVWNSP